MVAYRRKHLVISEEHPIDKLFLYSPLHITIALMNSGRSHILPYELKTHVIEVAVLLAPPFLDFLSIEIWVISGLEKEIKIFPLARTLYGSVTYCAAAIPIAYTSVVRIARVPVCHKVTPPQG